MGRPMAANLIRAGYPCTVYDLNPSRSRRWRAWRAAGQDGRGGGRGQRYLHHHGRERRPDARDIVRAGNAAQALPKGATVIGMSTMSRSFVQDARRGWRSWASITSTRRSAAARSARRRAS